MIFRRKHRHGPWRLEGMVYTPPPREAIEIEGHGSGWAQLLERTLYGVTTIRQTCSECGWTEVHTTTGRAKGAVEA